MHVRRSWKQLQKVKPSELLTQKPPLPLIIHWERKKTLIKIEEVRAKISDLERIQSSLEKLACYCNSSQDTIRQFKVQESFDLELGCKECGGCHESKLLEQMF